MPLLIAKNDYSFELIHNRFIVRASEKNRQIKGKAYKTATELTQILERLKQQRGSISLESHTSLSQFLSSLKKRVTASLQSKYSCLSCVVEFIQQQFHFGVLYEIEKTRELLKQIPIEKKAKELQLQPHETLFRRLNLSFAAVSLPKKEVQKQLIEKIEKVDLVQKFYEVILSEESLTLLLKACRKSIKLKNVYQRFLQIKAVKLEDKPFQPLEILRIAAFVESHFYLVKSTFFKQGQSLLARDLQYDGKTKTFYLIADPKKSLLNQPEKESSFKRLTQALELQQDHFLGAAKVHACLMTKIDGCRSEEIQQEVQRTLREIELYKRYKNVPGIVQFVSHVKFKEKNYNRLSLLFLKRTGNLSSLTHKLNFREKIIIAKDLISGLSQLHKESIVHADIKLQNTLFQLERGRVVAAELCDLGFSFSTKKGGSFYSKPPFVFSIGHAGKIGFSAPELYAVSDFQGSYYALDIWNLGCVFYHLFYEKALPWERELEEHTREKFDFSKGRYKNKKQLQLVQKSLQKQIAVEIEARIAHFSHERSTPTLQFEELIHQMLRLKPEKRLPIEELLKRIDRILLDLK
jgi:serine/threonine protein kinase